MFRSLLGHHQVALSLQSNCVIQSAYPMGEEISFTMVRYMNPNNRMVLIFVICIVYIVFFKTGVKQYEQNIVHSIKIANIGTILLIGFIYLTTVE